MWTLVEAIFAFLIARALWDFTKRRAKACNQSPLRWLLETAAALFALGGLLGIFVLVILYVLFQHH